jgi:hypothetical protein
MKTTSVLLILLVISLAFTSCKKKHDEPIKPYASFKVKGNTLEYWGWSKFNKMCIMSTYCATYYQDQADQIRNNLSIGLPSDAAAGKTYHTGQSKFYLIYFDNQGNKYYTYYGGNLTLTLDQWEGKGGYASGTFNGWIINENTLTDSVLIENGKFLGKIWYQ